MQARAVKTASSTGVLNNNDILLSKKFPREGWDLAAKKMNQENDDQLLFPDLFEDEIIDDWE
jgi:hypothetical protein